MKGRMLCATAGLWVVFVLLATTTAAAEQATAQLKDPDGKDVGTVELMEAPTGVLLTVKLKGTPPGEHGFHIHEVGKCEPDFAAAGGHFNPNETEHGFLSEEGPHSGDMPNLFVPESGELTAQIWNPMVTLTDMDDTLLDDDGSAIVIHAGADDYSSQPSGDSGDRIACGVIQ